MFNTVDYLGNEPWTGLIRMISDRTYLSLNPSHCIFKSLEAMDGLKTRVSFYTHRSSSETNILPSIPEEMAFIYTRLDPASYIGVRTVGTLKVPTDTTAVLKELSRQTGIVFSLDDFEGVEIEQYGSVTFNSKAESLRWVGKLTVNLVNQQSKPLPGLITKTDLGNVFLAPLASEQRLTDNLYFGALDFTKHRGLLRSLGNSPNGVHGDQLAVILQDVTGDPWVFSAAPSKYNLASEVTNGVPHSRIIYTGAPVMRYTTRTDKRRLIVLALNQTLCTGLKGNILIHYD